MSNDLSLLEDIQNSERLRDALIYRGKVDDLVEQAKPYLAAKRPLRPLPIPVSRRPFDPHDCLRSTEAIELDAAWSLANIEGLTKVIKDQCLADQEASESDSEADAKPVSATYPHRHVLDDFENGSPRMALLLLTMNREVVKAMIHGNLSSRRFEESAFEQVVQEHAKLDALPCIYCNQIGMEKWFGGTENQYPGRLVNWHQWVSVVKALQRYSEESRLGLDKSDWVIKVDSSFRIEART